MILTNNYIINLLNIYELVLDSRREKVLNSLIGGNHKFTLSDEINLRITILSCFDYFCFLKDSGLLKRDTK